MICKENHKYYMMNKTGISFCLNVGVVSFLIGLGYCLFTIPHDIKIGIHPKIMELESRIEDQQIVMSGMIEQLRLQGIEIKRHEEMLYMK